MAVRFRKRLLNVKKNGSGLFLRAGEVVVSPKLTAILGKSPRGHGSRRFLDKVICDFLAPFGSFSKEKKWNNAMEWDFPLFLLRHFLYIFILTI
jgi:hypothetical protein